LRGGLDSSLLGVKWRFYQQSSENGWHISTYPQLELNNLIDSDTAQAVDRSPRFLLPIEVAKVFGPVEINFEGGYWFARRTPGAQTRRCRSRLPTGRKSAGECGDSLETHKEMMPNALLCGRHIGCSSM